jgi:hypothetical protein
VASLTIYYEIDNQSNVRGRDLGSVSILNEIFMEAWNWLGMVAKGLGQATS